MKISIITFFFILITTISSQIVNNEITRIIDVSTSLLKIFVDIKASNVDNEYLLSFPTSQAINIAFLKATINKKELVISSPNQRYSNITMYSIEIKDDIDVDTSTLKIQAIFTNLLEPYPKEIYQNENQFVRFIDSHYFLSPYKTVTQKTTIKLATAQIESYTKLVPYSSKGSNIIFGSYKEIKPFENSPAIIHYQNNKPFAKFSNLIREIEVSHWGNIAIEEIYELIHHGAKLIGGFSRYKHQLMISNNYSTSSFDTLIAKLPKLANNIYYRDQIGNISSSKIKIKDEFLELTINPRFPMYGGWKTEFYIGYSLPSETSLFIQDDGTYLLKFNFNSIFQDVLTEDMEIKIILPEGCTDVNIDIPYIVEQSLSKRYTYLDSNINGGRQIIILKAKNIVKSHNKQVLIGYSFSTPRMLVEPFMLIMSFFIIFLVISIFLRINKSII